MSTVILFITEVHIKETTPVDENVEAKLIRNAIRDAQEMYILPILGTGLYNELRTQINAGTLTALNTTLLDDYISRALVFYTLYYGVDMFTYKLRNKGIMKQTSENSETITVEELKRLMDSYKNKAEWHSERLTKYLIENEADYPLYINPGNGVDTIYPNKNNYTTDWYLGGRNDCKPGADYIEL